VKANYQGRQVEATEVDFITRKEDFNEYQLADGKVLRVKTVLTDVARIEGEKDTEGNPTYIIKTTNIPRIK
jgi:hypothetical protein